MPKRKNSSDLRVVFLLNDKEGLFKKTSHCQEWVSSLGKKQPNEGRRFWTSRKHTNLHQSCRGTEVAPYSSLKAKYCFQLNLHLWKFYCVVLCTVQYSRSTRIKG